MSLLACLAVWTSLGEQASAQTLWRGARVGESLSHLQQDFPIARVPAEPQILSAGEVEGLRMAIPDLAGAPAEALFFMREQGLASVQLRAPFLRSASSEANLAFAERVSDNLSHIYGAPFACKRSEVAAIHQFTCKWFTGEIVVREYYLDVAGEAPVFYVAFHRADDPAFDL